MVNVPQSSKDKHLVPSFVTYGDSWNFNNWKLWRDSGSSWDQYFDIYYVIPVISPFSFSSWIEVQMLCATSLTMMCLLIRSKSNEVNQSWSESFQIVSQIILYAQADCISGISCIYRNLINRKLVQRNMDLFVITWYMIWCGKTSIVYLEKELEKSGLTSWKNPGNMKEVINGWFYFLHFLFLTYFFWLLCTWNQFMNSTLIISKYAHLHSIYDFQF